MKFKLGKNAQSVTLDVSTPTARWVPSLAADHPQIRQQPAG